MNILLTRQKYIQWHYLNMYNYSVFNKSSSNPRVKDISNPFKSKSFVEINRIMSLNQSKKNESILCKLVIKTTIERLQQLKNNFKDMTTSQTEINAKSQVLNKCSQKLIESMDTLSIEDIQLLTKFCFLTYQSKTIRITSKNRLNFFKQLLDQLRRIVNQDKEGRHAHALKRILYMMLKMKKKSNSLKLIINYLSQHDLKTNQQVMIFFKHFVHVNKIRYYDNSLLPIVSKLVNSRYNRAQNCKEWLSPIIMQIANLFSDKLQIRSNRMFTKIFNVLEQQLQKNDIQINDQISYFRQLLSWASLIQPHTLELQDAKKGVTLTYNMLADIIKRIQAKEQVKFESFYIINQSRHLFKDFSKNHFVISKDMTEFQLFEKLEHLYNLLFQNSFISSIKKLNSQTLSSILTKDLDLSRSQLEKLVIGLLQFLDQQGFQAKTPLINYIRIPEFITKSIYLGKIDKKYQQRIIKLLKNINIDSSLNNLQEFQFYRVFNISKFLNVQATKLEEFYRFNYKKKLPQIIQNMTRTVLKDSLLKQILEANQALIQKHKSSEGRQQIEESSRDLGRVIWFSFKGSGIQTNQQNRNALFLYWMSEDNIKIFKNIQNEIYQMIFHHAIKEINLGTKSVINSVNFQVIFQFCKIYLQKVKDKTFKIQQQKRRQTLLGIYEDIKLFVQSQKFKGIFQRNFRHSFFIKFMWASKIIVTYIKSSFQKYRFLKLYTLFSQLMKLQQTRHYRQKPRLTLELLRKKIKVLCIDQEIKIRCTSYLINFWEWLNYFSFPETESFVNSIRKADEPNLILNEYIKTQNKAKYFQYLVCSGSISIDIQLKQIQNLLNGSFIPPQIYQGKLQKSSVIYPSVLLDLLIYQRTLAFFMKKYPQLSDIFIQKICQIDNIFYPHKIIEAANLVNNIRSFLSLQTRDKFKKWVQGRASNPKTNPSMMPVYLQLNLIPKQSKDQIDSYIKRELLTNNFNLVGILYINNYTGISNQLRQVFDLSLKNRVFAYLQQYFPSQYLLLLNHFLGAALNQMQIQILIFYTNLFLNQQNKLVDIIQNSYVQDKNNLVSQFYILLQVCKNRFKSSNNQQEHQIIANLSGKIKQIIPRVEQQTLHKICKTSALELKIERIELTTKPVNEDIDFSLPVINDKYIIVNPQQTGYYNIVLQYLKECRKMKQVDIMTIEEIRRSIGAAKQ